MSNGAGSPIDIQKTGAAFRVSFPNEFDALKYDTVPITAAQVPEFGGQIWSNLVDDAIVALVDQTFANTTAIAGLGGAGVQYRYQGFTFSDFSTTISIAAALPADAIVIRAHVAITTDLDGTVQVANIGESGDASIGTVTIPNGTNVGVYALDVHEAKASTQLTLALANDVLPAAGVGAVVVEFITT